jgi:hypothetical protein
MFIDSGSGPKGDLVDLFSWPMVNINSSLTRKRLPAADAPRESESGQYHTLLGGLHLRVHSLAITS